MISDMLFFREISVNNISREAEIGKDFQGLMFGDNLDDENARPPRRQFLEDCIGSYGFSKNRTISLVLIVLERSGLSGILLPRSSS